MPPVVPSAFLRAHRHLDIISIMLLVAREFGPLVEWKKGSHLYLAADAELVHHILVGDRDSYKKSEFAFGRMSKMVGEGLLTNLSDSWFERRKLLQKVFTRNDLDRYANQAIQGMTSFLDNWEARAKEGVSFNLYDEMMMLVMMHVTKNFLSDDLREEKARELVRFNLNASRGVQYKFILSPWFPSPTFLRFRYAVWHINAYIGAVIDARQKMSNKPDDLITFLLDQNMPRQVIMDEAKTAILAGHETTGTALTWCYHLLMQHPLVYQRMQEEVRDVVGARALSIDDLGNLPYLCAVWEESLRLYPPTWGLPRTSVRPDILAGYDIPRGAGFLISPYVIHRLAQYWHDPDAFKPERFLAENRVRIHKSAYIPYNTGPHMCIAKHLATRQAQIMLAMIAQRFSFLRTSVNPEPLPKEFLLTMRPSEPILVKLVRHK